MKKTSVLALILSLLILAGCTSAANLPEDVTSAYTTAADTTVADTTTADTTTAETSAEITTAANTSEVTEEMNVQKKTLSGQPFTVENYSALSGDEYTLKKADGAALVELVPANCLFNCFAITYSSTSPLECVATYSSDGKEINDRFWLEPGTDVTFTSLTDGYTSGKSASSLTSISVAVLKNTRAVFKLTDVKYTLREACPGVEVYINNDKVKLGVHLEWGGGISYYENLADGDESIANLLNSHDTGRLVQQSYYGTSSSPYVPATYSGQTWSYNPVQGGNQYNQKSRLIDFSISDDGKSIYVKCLPRDWAQKDLYALCYLENTYSIVDNYVKVDNRFYDFSGYSWPNSHQELPAFYTISYLSRFSYYAGNSAWTDGPITTLPDEPFWAGRSEAYHNMKSKETWAAWTAPDGFGIGVYTPIATILLAGRFSYDGSKDPNSASGSTNYVAPLVQRSMGSFAEFRYSYFITSGKLEDMRATFKSIYEGQIK